MLTEPHLHDASAAIGTTDIPVVLRPPVTTDSTDTADSAGSADSTNQPFDGSPGRPVDLTALPTGRARCSDGAGTLASLFFSDDDFDIARAKAVCRTCALSAECLQGALDRNESYGVWGGVLLIDGEPARFARRRGRPPAIRIETVAEEVPIPEHLVA